MVPIMGESRAAFVYPRPGRTDAVRDHLEAAYPNWFVVRDSVEALESGLMGKPIADETYARAGELIVLPRGTRALQQTQPSVSLAGPAWRSYSRGDACATDWCTSGGAGLVAGAPACCELGSGALP